MKSLIRPALGLLVLSLAALGSAYDFTPDHQQLSGVHDDSNLQWTDQFFSATLQKTAAEGDVFINDAVYDFSSWDSGINIDTDFQNLNNYTFGTAISGDFYSSLQVGYRFGAIDSGVANGTYSFSVDFIGGNSSSSTDLMGSFTYSLTVIDRFDVALTASLDNTVLTAGQTSTLTATATSHMADTWKTNSWYISSGTQGAYPTVPYQFLGNWFGVNLNNGDSNTDLHSSYTPDGSTPAGTYFTYGGIIGGLYDGDDNAIKFEQTPSFQVNAVPEPFSLIGLGSLALLGLKRRKRA